MHDGLMVRPFGYGVPLFPHNQGCGEGRHRALSNLLGSELGDGRYEVKTQLPIVL